MDSETLHNIGGWHQNARTRKEYDINWPIGSIFANEGKRLYDLVKELKPKLIVEVGAHAGCSTTWIATALSEIGAGKLHSIDVRSDSHWLFPKHLKKWVKIIHSDALTMKPIKNIDLLFEDGMHTYGFTQSVLERFPAKVMVSHDYMHWDCKNTVKREFNKVLGEPDEIFFEAPSDCGLAIKYMK